MPAPNLVDVARGNLTNGGAEHLDRHNTRFAGGDVAHGEGTAHFYALVTDFYEYGWGQSFHFAPRYQGESLAASIARLEHSVAHRLGLTADMRVLDAGCGVGGPMRSIARFTGCRVDGVTITPYQIERANTHNREAGLADRCQAHLGDFTALDWDDDTFDAAFTFEAICHTDDRSVVFAELSRVVKPGGAIGGTDWCLTDRYDDSNSEHRRIRRLIEEGNGLGPLYTVDQFREELERSGLEVEAVQDLNVTAPSTVPWYHALEAGWDSLQGVRRTRIGRAATSALSRVLEVAKIAPKGTYDTSEMLNRGADGLVAGGRLGIFTPVVFFHARKPS